jgi:hypothetical protein
MKGSKKFRHKINLKPAKKAVKKAAPKKATAKKKTVKKGKK